MNKPLSSEMLPSRIAFAQAQTAGSVSHSRPDYLFRGLLACFLFFHFPAFTYQLAMDPSTGRWTGSPILQFFTISSEIFAIVAIVTSRKAISVAIHCWPIWILIALIFLSTAWSISPMTTLQAANTSMSTMLMGLAIAARLPGFQCIRFLIRTMSLGCALSVVWVMVFPETAVHQATDIVQSVHAGLWRGIFSHKQGLGYFAGMTTGLLLFYNLKVFSPLALVPALVCSVICLFGTQSTTGILASIFTPLIFYMAHWSTRFPPQTRRSVFVVFAAIGLLIAVAYKFGLLNFFIVQVLSKSTDLTGRVGFWDILLQNFEASDRNLLGGGFDSGFSFTLYETNVDNGYIDRFLEFGYLFSPIIFATYAFIVYSAIKLVIRSRSEYPVRVFPFGIMAIILLINITESNFLTKSLSTVLTSVAVVLIVQQGDAHPPAPPVGRYFPVFRGRTAKLRN